MLQTEEKQMLGFAKPVFPMLCHSINIPEIIKWILILTTESHKPTLHLCPSKDFKTEGLVVR